MFTFVSIMKLIPEKKKRKNNSSLVRISNKHIELSTKYRRNNIYKSKAEFIEKAIEEKNNRENNFRL